MGDRTRGSRREFLAEVGAGVLAVTVGPALATDMGLTRASAAEGDHGHIRFGAAEPLVDLLQATPADRLIPILVDRLRSGTTMLDLLAAAAFANARSFAGEDYVGFHTMMALAPAYRMAMELPEPRRALPVLKVLYRNTARIQEMGGTKAEAMRPVEAEGDALSSGDGVALREAIRSKDAQRAEQIFAAMAVGGSAADTLNGLLPAVHDATEVHRIVMPYRAWDLLDLIGKERAGVILRQSVRYCLKSESGGRSDRHEPRALLPRLLDAHKLLGRSEGTRKVDDAWVDRMARTLFESTPEVAADAVASALAEGIVPGAIGEAISLAANQLVLRDAGRTASEVRPGKPEASVHGDSIGVHASDSANAWRNLARVSDTRNRISCLILGGYQVALDRVSRGGDFLHWQPRPHADELAAIRIDDLARLLAEAESAIRAKDQSRVTAIVHKIGAVGGASRPVFDLMLKYAVTEDGSLHAEKYYRTVSEEFAAARPVFQWRHLTALARVTASEYGQPALGVADARARLGV